jgi:hypothetical protein
MPGGSSRAQSRVIESGFRSCGHCFSSTWDITTRRAAAAHRRGRYPGDREGGLSRTVAKPFVGLRWSQLAFGWRVQCPREASVDRV